MGGEIGIESETERGSTFWFVARFGKQPVAMLPDSESTLNLSGWRALIVDANPTSRRIMRYQASSWGMVTAETETGDDAIALLLAGVAGRQSFDLAFINLNIPDIDGIELIRKIKSDPKIAGTNLIILSSSNHRDQEEKVSQIGVDGYLSKPVRQSDMYNCLMTTKSRRVSETVNDSAIARPPAESSGHKETATERYGIHILVAEDNIVNRMVALKQLKNLGYDADVATNGLEVLEAMTLKRYDVILMDCQMPEMDGYETTAGIREKEDPASRTTIISMTARALEGEREKRMAAGMDYYISKPVKTETLRQLLDRWCGVENNRAL